MIQHLDSMNFDPNQFGYLNGRGPVQALLFTFEKIKTAMMEQKEVAAIFFDFTDAFGCVDRTLLLSKIAKDFKVSGHLFLHICSFLEGRLARLKVNDLVSDWNDSIYGTSAGTIWGPILFLIFVSDIPEELRPKFADDVAAVIAEASIQEVESSLQQAVMKMESWCRKWGMTLNASKTKIMLFGRSYSLSVNVLIDGKRIEIVLSFKYLGVLLDPQMNFTMQVDAAVAKAKRACGKICFMIKGRFGLPIQIGITLYKALVRPHLEYGLPAWGKLKESDILKMERLQSQCLKNIMGLKIHSSSDAVDVIAAVTPVRLRMRQICCKQFVKLSVKRDDTFKQLMVSSARQGQFFPPLCWIKVMSAEVAKKIENHLQCERLVKPEHILCDVRLERVDIFKGVCIGNSGSRSQAQKDLGKRTVEQFVKKVERGSIIALTDGSVAVGSVGCGGCSAVFVPNGKEEDVFVKSEAVGMNVDNVHCELVGIVLALEGSLEVISQYQEEPIKEVYIGTDCISAIEIATLQNDFHKHATELERINELLKKLAVKNVKATIFWCPGHADYKFNELADKEAKKMATLVLKREVEASYSITKEAGLKLCEKITIEAWERRWAICGSGSFTRDLIPSVGTKVRFPSDRDTAISYCRLLVGNVNLKDQLFRYGIEESPNCVCGDGVEDIEHFLLECKNHDTERQVMLNGVKNVCSRSKKTDVVIDKKLLLSPEYIHGLSKAESYQVKDFVFAFIKKIGRKL